MKINESFQYKKLKELFNSYELLELNYYQLRNTKNITFRFKVEIYFSLNFFNIIDNEIDKLGFKRIVLI